MPIKLTANFSITALLPSSDYIERIENSVKEIIEREGLTVHSISVQFDGGITTSWIISPEPASM